MLHAMSLSSGHLWDEVELHMALARVCQLTYHTGFQCLGETATLFLWGRSL